MKKIYNKKNSLPPNTYYVYGKHSSIEALKNTKRKILEVYCSNNIYLEYEEIIKQFKFQLLSNIEIDEILNENLSHQGIIVKTQNLTQDDLSAIDLYKEQSVIIILDQITDPQNVGAIIRNASAFGADAIITTKTNAVLENSIICKVSAGGVEKINLLRVSNIINAIEILKANNYWIIGLDGAAKTNIDHKYLKGKIAFVLGSEGEGLRKLVKEKMDLLYRIPILNIESLNVSSASAIALYAYCLANQ